MQYQQQQLAEQIDNELKHKYKMYTGIDADDRNFSVYTPEQQI